MWIEKHGKFWRIREKEGDRKVTLLGGLPTKAVANARMTAMLVDQARGDFIDPRGGQVTFGQWVDTWWPTYAPSLKPSSLDSAEGILRRYVRPQFDPVPLGDIDPLMVQAWSAALLTGTLPGMKRGIAVKTVMNAHGVLHKVLSAAVFQQLIRENPAKRTGLPEKPEYEARFLTEPEAARLLAAVADHWRPLVLVLLSTGLRWSEAVGLKVDKVDILARKLTVTITMQERVGSGELVFVTPKSKKSRRTVTFTLSVATALIPLVAGKERDALVFTNPDGTPVRYRIFRKQVWIKARNAAGLEGLRLHDCRHTHAAWLISAGVPLTAIQRRLGHSSIKVTSDLYGHLLPEVDEGIIAAVNRALPEPNLGGHVGESGQLSVSLGSSQAS